MSRNELLDKIRAVGFAMHEAALFLDTHPECPAALDYFAEMRDELARLTAEYEKSYGPLTYTGVSGDSWTWVDGEWPWHAGNGAVKNARREK